MKEYEIKRETVTPGYYLDEKKDDGSVERKFIKTSEDVDKWYIYYYKDGHIIDKSVYSYDGVNHVDDFKIAEGFVNKETGVEHREKINASKIDIQSIIDEIKKEYDLTPKRK